MTPAWKSFIFFSLLLLLLRLPRPPDTTKAIILRQNVPTLNLLKSSTSGHKILLAFVLSMMFFRIGHVLSASLMIVLKSIIAALVPEESFWLVKNLSTLDQRHSVNGVLYGSSTTRLKPIVFVSLSVKFPTSPASTTQSSPKSSLSLPLSPHYARLLVQLAAQHDIFLILSVLSSRAGSSKHGYWQHRLSLKKNSGTRLACMWRLFGHLAWQDRLNSLNLPFLLPLNPISTNAAHTVFPWLSSVKHEANNTKTNGLGRSGGIMRHIYGPRTAIAKSKGTVSGIESLPTRDESSEKKD
ncbi:hypothetical protein K435DRAFT_922007 [Dendrothele bispora CBS 962.96]|uniref:Uncharacterized protein n=1 Tax=Dendrothele bispora (strain CBS 962.96) TaxID=1314807 RepID=A0A4S8LDD4_DENBC|nr:hypothetical protein K435DRAFT_922007 [Dendrothele bispora CBS 962.96]